MKQRLAIITLVLLVIGAGLYWFVRNSEDPATPDRSHFKRDPNLKSPRMGTAAPGAGAG